METISNLVAILIVLTLLWFILWFILKLFGFIKKKLFPPKDLNQKKQTSKTIIHAPVNSSLKPPTILSDLTQPGFPGKIFTLFFMPDGLVFAKTGIGSTDIAGGQRAYWGGAGPKANLAGAIGGLIDYFLSNRRSEVTAEVASFDSAGIVSANKHNFILRYENVTAIKIKRQRWFSQIKLIFVADKEYRFRVNTNSDHLFNYYLKILKEFLPGKVLIE